MGAWRRLDRVTLRERGDFEAYVRQAVQNRIRDEARRQDRRAPATSLDSNVPDAQPSPFEQAVGRELSERYEAAFSQLTDDERELIVARLEYGYAYQEVAELLNRPSAAAARMATGRAIDRLKELMAGAAR
jgi:RNA polymerase sigma-70 factor (ECF subfamily)